MPLRFVPPDNASPEGAGPFPQLLAEAAGRLGGRFETESEHGFLGRYHAADGRAWPVLGKALGLNSDAATAVAADKHYTAGLLRADGLPVPDGVLVAAPRWLERMGRVNRAVADRMRAADPPEAFAARVGYPVIVKPNTGYGGRGVRCAPDAAALAADLADGFRSDDLLRVERQVSGKDHRLLVLDGQVVLAYRRLPLSVTGDGRQTLGALIDAALTGLARDHRGQKIDAEDPRLLRTIAAQGMTRASVPPEGTRVRLLDHANLSEGGQMAELTGALSAEAEALALRATACLGLRMAGVDILAADLATGADGAHILEVNAAPGLDYYASSGPAQRARAVSVLTRALDLLG